MTKNVFKIDHTTNNFKLYNHKDHLKYTASWFLEFGKTTSEVYNLEKEIIFSITKKFNFWKWKVSYSIKDKEGTALVLQSDNKQNSSFSMNLNAKKYQVKIHYKQKKSFFKNGIKIAEIDDAFLTSKEENTSNLLLLHEEDLTLVFLLFMCLKTGETNQKPIIKSQKEWIPIEEQWT